MISLLGKQSPFISFLKKQRWGPEPSPQGEVETKRHWAALHIKIRGYSPWLENGITLGSFEIFGNVSSLGLGGWVHAGGWKFESCYWGVTGKGDWGRLETWGPAQAPALNGIMWYILSCAFVSPLMKYLPEYTSIQVINRWPPVRITGQRSKLTLL